MRRAQKKLYTREDLEAAWLAAEDWIEWEEETDRQSAFEEFLRDITRA